MALAAGARPGECLYTGPGKTAAELDHALARGLRLFSVDSPTDLARLGDRARRQRMTVRALLRLNPTTYPPGAGLAMGGSATQFGADVDWVRREPRRFAADGVRLVGYHVYVGTGAGDLDQLAAWVDLAVDAVTQAQAVLRLDVELVDLGGGFPQPFARAGARPDLCGLRAPVERSVSRLPAGAAVAFESGRYLAGAAGSLLLRVQDVKVSKGVRVVIVDGGVNVLGGMSGLRRVPPILAEAVPPVLAEAVPPRPAPPDGGEQPDTAAAMLVGPLCSALDVLNRRRSLPDVAPGDLLMVQNVGAYGLTASLVAFLSRAAPAEICVAGSVVTSALRLALGYHTLPADLPAGRPPCRPTSLPADLPAGD